MLLRINELYQGQHEVRILTADVKEEKMPVYKMTFWMPRLLRFFEFIFRGYAFYKGIQRVQQSFDFDIVFFGNAMYGLITKLFLSRKPVGGMINDDHTIIINLRNFIFYAGGKSLIFLKHVEKLNARKLDFIITCSDYLKNFVCRAYEVPEQNVCKLYQAVDVKNIRFRLREMDSENTIKILFVKHRFDIGRIEDLAKAVALNSKFHFYISIAGPYKKDERKVNALFKLIKNAEIDFLGPLSQKEVHIKMDTHHILCIPSVLEAQGLTNIEGMAHGIYVVSSNAGGIPEVLDDGNNGWMCEPLNPASLAGALEDCITANSETKNAIAKRARKFAEENFDFPVCIKNLLKILEERIYVFENKSLK